MKFQIGTKPIKSNKRLHLKNITTDNSEIHVLEIGVLDQQGSALGRLVVKPTGITWFKNNAYKNGKQMTWEEVSDRQGKQLLAN